MKLYLAKIEHIIETGVETDNIAKSAVENPDYVFVIKYDDLKKEMEDGRIRSANDLYDLMNDPSNNF